MASSGGQGVFIKIRKVSKEGEQEREMAFILMNLEEQLSALLWQIAQDYELDHGELCERYLGTTEVAKPAAPKRAAAKKASGGEKKKCCGRTVKGAPCKKNALDGSDYCKTHGPKEATETEEETEAEGPKLCCGKTSKGAACKKRAASGSDYCKTHEPKEELQEEEEEEKPEMCQALTGKKQPCKKKAVCDGFCKTHSKGGPLKLKEPVHNHEPGEEAEGCDSCSMYGDPINGASRKVEIIDEDAEEEVEKPVRRSERLKLQKLLEHVETENMDEIDEEGADDLLSFAQQLEEELEAEEF